MVQQAGREGRSPAEIARFYEAAFRRDTAALNMRTPEHTPRAPETIDLMIDLIARLIEQGHAYAVDDGTVFFDARSFPTYGEISGNRLDALKPGHRHEGVDPRKRFHADWALWKGSDRDLTWQAPWGRGFPGWHIECSAMSLRLLGEHIDIHTGGKDLRFPHHEDERAQSNASVGHDVVKHWVHGEHVLFDGRKMAKSTGNVVLLSDVEAAGLDPLAVRLALLEHRYRQQMNLTWETLHAADRTLRRWRQRVAEWAESPSRPIAAEYASRAQAAFDDDLDTPAALRVLRELERDESVEPGSRTSTTCSPSICRPTSARRPWPPSCHRARPSCWSPGPRPARARTGPPPTASATNWPPSASRSPTPPTARPGPDAHSAAFARKIRAAGPHAGDDPRRRLAGAGERGGTPPGPGTVRID